VRGASALQELLDEEPAPVTVFAVWEPVGPDHGPPPAAVLARLHDPRVAQLWDPDHLVSDLLRDIEHANPGSPPQARLRTDERDDGVLYDAVVLFEPGTSWRGAPAWVDGGLAKVLPELRTRLGQ
jgi:hypothetical protein